MGFGQVFDNLTFTRDRIQVGPDSPDPISEVLRGVYTRSDLELLAFTRDRIHFDFMNLSSYLIRSFEILHSSRLCLISDFPL